MACAQVQADLDKKYFYFKMIFFGMNVTGAIFGGVGALRMGLRGGELIQTVGKVMVQGGGTFGTFMSIGTAIRC